MNQMKYILFYLCAAALSSPSQGFAKSVSCTNTLWAFNTYDEMDAKGKLIENYSKFPPHEFSNDASYESLIAKKSMTEKYSQIQLIVSVSSSFGKTPTIYKFDKTEMFELDPDYLKFVDSQSNVLSFKKLFQQTEVKPASRKTSATSGVFSIELKNGETSICKNTFGFSSKGD